MSFKTEKKEDCCAIKSPRFGKLDMGQFARNKQREFALIGATDEDIQSTAVVIAEKIPPPYKVGFVHILKENNRKRSIFNAEYIEKNGLHHIVADGKKGCWQYRDMMSEMDIVLVNGNYFQAENTIDINQDLNSILKNIVSKIQAPTIKGLVLAGGRSTRMGSDKGKLNYHGKPQREYVTDMLENMGIEAYISCREDQVADINGYKTVTDAFNDMGPAGGIMSAFLLDPNAAWLALACDLPLLTEGVVRHLIAERNPAAIATAYLSPENEQGFPEPLIALWEPKAFPEMLRFLSQGVMCPRKVLINADTHLIDPSVPTALMNANTADDKVKVIDILKNNNA